jgi:FkbM family methyltransferase
MRPPAKHGGHCSGLRVLVDAAVVAAIVIVASHTVFRLTAGTTATPQAQLHVLEIVAEADPVADTRTVSAHYVALPREYRFERDMARVRLCVDVGANTGSRSAQLWWSEDPATFVVALEPNPVAAALLRAAYRTEATRFLPIHAAVANVGKDAVARFQLGMANRSDVGSLLHFRRSYARKHVTSIPGTASVPAVSLAALLRWLPREATWDTLKIDAQGMDAVVLLSALETEDGRPARTPQSAEHAIRRLANASQHPLARFRCIVGEFDNRAYAATTGQGSDADEEGRKQLVSFRFRRLLRALGFLPVDDRTWFNRRYAAVVRGRPSSEWGRHFHCTAGDRPARDPAAFLRVVTAA